MPRRSIGSFFLRWLKRVALALVAVFVVVLAAGSIWEAVSWRRTLSRYPPTGEMVDIGGRRIHLDCRGTGSPTVVFEAGLDPAGALSWELVHDAMAEQTRACAYSRAGIVWSDPSPAPHDAVTVANDLHATLSAAQETGPFVLVGHSLGGPYAMTYTKLHRDEVAGLVFVDASHPDQVARVAEAIGRVNGPPPAERAAMGLVAKLRWTGLPRLIARQVPLFEKLPEPRVDTIRSYLPRSFGQMLLEARSLPATLAEAGTFRDLGSRPLVVLTAMPPPSEAVLAAMRMTLEEAQAFQSEWKTLHDEEAAWSTRSRHELVPDATHYIQMDRPDVVIRAVLEVVETVRADAASEATGADA